MEISPHVPDPRGVDDWRERAYRVVFGHDTKAGRVFDVLLIVAILASVTIALMDSVASLHARYGPVTISTVGFGDIAPATPLGRLIAGVLILIGYGVIVVPAGIYTAELMSMLRLQRDTRECAGCGLKGHEADARHCRRCGARLYSDASTERAP